MKEWEEKMGCNAVVNIKTKTERRWKTITVRRAFKKDSDQTCVIQIKQI